MGHWNNLWTTEFGGLSTCRSGSNDSLWSDKHSFTTTTPTFIHSLHVTQCHHIIRRWRAHWQGLTAYTHMASNWCLSLGVSRSFILGVIGSGYNHVSLCIWECCFNCLLHYCLLESVCVPFFTLNEYKRLHFLNSSWTLQRMYRSLIWCSKFIRCRVCIIESVMYSFSKFISAWQVMMLMTSAGCFIIITFIM